MATTVAPVKTSTRNITRYFRSLDPAVIAEGREWYPKARALAEELAENTVSAYDAPFGDDWDREVTKAAAVIAVLSPRLNWERNKFLAKLVYGLVSRGTWTPELTVDEVRKGWGHGLTDGATKAFRILVLNEDPNEVVGGPKVRSFWFTILNPNDPRAVVVDRHAMDVAAGRVLTDAERGRLVATLGKYDTLAEEYRRAAKILSRELDSPITPAEVQAITWTAWRRQHAHAAKANRIAEGV